MAISEAYQETLKRRAVNRFIKDKGRSPTLVELRDLVRREKRNFSSVDQVGLSGSEIRKPQYRDISSAVVENTNRYASFDDMFTVSNRLDDLTQLLEDSFRGFQGTARRTNRLLNQLESRIDNLLLLNTNVDVFVNGLEETFDTQEYIDITNTTASVESGYCTLGRQGYTPVPLDTVRLTATTTSAKGIIGSQSSGDINLLKEDDGSYWEHVVYTKNRQGRVSLILEMEMPEPIYIGDLRVMGSGINVNQHTTITVFYSLDGKTFTALEPVEQVLETDENVFNIGLDDVQKIQILVSKTASDNVTTTANQYVYVFSFDSIKIFSDRFTDNKESILIAGPYTVTDETGIPVGFTKATLTACVTAPEDTSVNFSLSKDGESWVPVNINKESLSIVSFGDGSKTGTEVFIDQSISAFKPVEEAAGVEELNFTTEALINTGIAEAFADAVPTRSIKIKRNVKLAGSPDTIYGVGTGWFFDESTSRYTTTVKVEAPEGRYIDVGPTGMYVNGTLLTGTIHLKEGYSSIETDDANWAEITEGLTSVNALKAVDPLYPYNHKYLIEGYVFPAGFKGDKLYTGVDEYFGRLLQFIPPEQFNAIDDTSIDRLRFFTIEDADGNHYFKVKVDKTDASWKDEFYELDWLVQSDESSDIYVRAILTTSNSEQSPIIHKYGIRVI